MHRISSIFFIMVLVMAEKAGLSIGGDTLSKGESLTGNQTLTSKNGMFELGFFQPNSNPNTNRFYLSIRYTKFGDGKTIVWTANRDKPLADKSASKLEISADGNLQLYDGDGESATLWSSKYSSSPEKSSRSSSHVVAVLGDDGNLILRDGRPGLTAFRFWQSFDHPTDTWLPRAMLGGGRRLVSWKSDDDPSPGMFSAEIEEGGRRRIVLKRNGEEEFGEFELDNKLASFSFGDINQFLVRLENNQFNIGDGNSSLDSDFFGMIVMDHREGRLSGLISWRVSAQGQGRWNSQIENLTEAFSCGANGILISSSSSSTTSKSPCECLPGFTPLSKSLVDWRCSRKIDLDCEEKEKKKDVFEVVSVMKIPDNPKPLVASNETECEAACLSRSICSCTAYAFINNIRECIIWEGDLLGTRRQQEQEQQQEEDMNTISEFKQKLHLRLAIKGDSSNTLMEVIIAVVVPLVVILFAAFLGYFYNIRRTKHNYKAENKESGEDLLSFDFNSTTNFRKTTSSSNIMEFDLPMFNYSSVSAATNNFSPLNKIGEGGFGPVYKGELINGQEIALKRLSKKSGQGLEEFRNEVLVIAKLQHRNLVRLLGCCIAPNESILIYEYMPNKSLDLFLFGSHKQDIVLDWPTRIRIVEGIAQGLLYLHEHSRLRIIHRDLKASNILLDQDMNPKISDFGMARIFGGNDSRAYTNKVVGTFGYIAPEYALEGLFSTMSDVYSFGVMVLEIVSGRKNTGFYKTDSLHLLGHAWDLWISDRGVELVDDKVGSEAAASTALRYINVGLLCVQENPNDRPNMSSVVSMLSSEIAALPPPKRPAFSTTSLISTSSSSTRHEGDPYLSVNNITASDILPR